MTKTIHIIGLLALLILLPAQVQSFQPFPDTGQTMCYDADHQEVSCDTIQPGDPLYGQDGHYQPRLPRSYTKLGHGGVELSDNEPHVDDGGYWIMTRDNVTGLIWEIKSNDNKSEHSNWHDAQDVFIPGLNDNNHGGFSDWRMPTIKELSSLVNAGNTSRTIDIAWFPNTRAGWYWSNAYSTNYAWCIPFGSSYLTAGSASYSSKSLGYRRYVRAVRAGQSDIGSSDPLVINDDGTVTDPNTGLMWQEETAPGKYTWKQALEYAGELNLGGYSDWRLPDRNELQSLVDYSQHNPAIAPVLAANTVSSNYWSSTSARSSFAWRVYFKNGAVYCHYDKSNSHYVRAVRAGQSDIGSFDDILISQSPLVNPPGAAFSQWGTGFTPDTNALIHHKKPDGTEYPPVEQPINSYGQFETSWIVPYDVQPGTYTWWAIDPGTGRQSNTIAYEIYPAREGLASFEISSISSPQQENIDVPIMISALDHNGQLMSTANINVSIDISGLSGVVSPARVKLNNGQWSGNIRILTTGENLRLEVFHGGAFGKSNTFSVLNEKPYAGIMGRLKDGRGNIISIPVKVELFREGFSRTIDVSNGMYYFDEVPPGLYNIRVTPEDDSGPPTVLRDKYITAQIRLIMDIEITMGAPAGRIPVLLVPGIMGSASTKENSFYPKLPKNRGQDDLKMYNPTRFDVVGWDTLIEKFEKIGYKKNVDLFEVPYDWRMDIDDIVKKYLIEAITNAKNQTNQDRVDIIAHSMGGLVARAYIQGDHGYGGKKDIRRFAMVGTPNAGVPLVYYLWQGGDPLIGDNISGSTTGSSLLYFYTNTTAENFENELGYSPIIVLKERKFSYKSDIDYSLLVKSCYAYYHGIFGNEKISGLHQLLPNDFFLAAENKACRKIEHEKNSFLYDLNHGVYKDTASEYMGKPGEEGRTETVIFAGNDLNTVANIEVGAPDIERTRYQDGQPQPPDKQEKSAVINTAGDGTVPLDSALFPYHKGWAEKMEREGEHRKLIKIFADELVSFINTGEVAEAQVAAIKPMAFEETEEFGLSISFTGPVRALLVNPDGLAAGIDPETREYTNDIPGTDMLQLADGGYITGNNPAEGEYSLKLTGTAASSYTLNFSLSDTDDNFYFKASGFNHELPIEINFILEPAADEKIRVTNLPLPPENLRADMIVDAGNLTRLSWAPPSDQTKPIVEYRVYAKTVYEPRFFPVGTTAALFLDTDHVWAENNTIPERVYYVTSVAENGTESFFSDATLNNDRDHDGLTDALEIELGTDINTPDTDGDGLTDGEEYWTYGTDPLLADTDNDGYSDFIEIMAGSDPLDPDSIPLKGDISGDHGIDFDDALIGLQIMTGRIPSELGALTADINDDGKIGMEEVIYIFEKAGGLR